ncbi:hypothetical protein OROHE_018524 [Orobanche hederae]
MSKKAWRGENQWLPEHLIEEILVKLPVDSLSRFRCVCKSWYDLIKSSDFVERHLLKHHYNSNDNINDEECILILRGRENRCLSYLSFHSYETLSLVSSQLLQIPMFDYFTVNFCGPCNGLICISNEETIVLCNPAIRECNVVPRPFSVSPQWRINISALGLGFDPTTNDYKVVAMFRFSQYSGGEGYYDKAGIYNLGTNSWREIEYEHKYPHVPDHVVNGTLFNGAFHWIVWSVEEQNHSILSFDFSTEQFGCLELPIDYLDQDGFMSLMVLNKEYLALFAWSERDAFSERDQFVDVWVMREYSVPESWKKHLVAGPIRGLYNPLPLWKKNECILIDSSRGELL